MSKGRRPPSQQPLPRDVTGEVDRAIETTLEEQLLGNQAVQSQLGTSGLSPTDQVRAVAADLAHRTAVALCVEPRPAEWSERLVGLVERSQLPGARKEAIVERLRSDQATADEVAAAMLRWVGEDGPEVRSSLVTAFDVASRDAATQPVADGASVAERAERLVAESVGRQIPTATVEAVASLTRSLALLVQLVWDEEEEEGAPGDYAAEESGI